MENQPLPAKVGQPTAGFVKGPEEKRRVDRRVVINVGGERHETRLSTLERIPGTRLALLARLQEADETYDLETNEYFFDRNPRAFGVIMHYLRTEELHINHSICGNVLKMELQFWGVEEHEIEACCWAEYSKYTEHREALRDLDENFSLYCPDQVDDNESRCRRFARLAWRFLEEPTSSKGAKVYAILSMFFVVLSVVIFVLETHKLFQVDEKSGISMAVLEPVDNTPTGNSKVTCCCETDNATASSAIYSPTTHPVLRILDYICAAFFSLEIIVRFSFAPNKIRFWKDPLNLIDIVCLIPHFTSIILVALDYINSTNFPIKTFMVLRVVRILRIFKLMKHYSAFKILVYTIKVSTKELMLMIIFLMSGVLMFASIIHYVEKENFPNIPIGIWWATVTMTTVGYGDKYPVDYYGYMVGCACVISGVLVIAFTVPIVVNNFSLYYAHAQTRIKLPQRRRRPRNRLYKGADGEASTGSTSLGSLSARTTTSVVSDDSRSSPLPPTQKKENDRNQPDRKTPTAISQKTRLTSHGRQDARNDNDVTPVGDILPLRQESEKLMEALHHADKKLESERKRQEFKLKLKRDQKIQTQAKQNEEAKKVTIDAKMSDGREYVNNT